MDDEDQQYWEFSYMSKSIGIIYTPTEMDRFHYSLCSRDRYSISNMNEYGREWDYCMEESRQLKQNLRQFGLKRPKQRSLQVPRGNVESLELAINIVPHENNQIQIRINRYDNSSRWNRVV
ncbi:hypothetical protein P8452_33395 [Trifolium repens]|nr:hypothetical protein P8452_33395 [Trifolium repens]